MSQSTEGIRPHSHLDFSITKKVDLGRSPPSADLSPLLSRRASLPYFDSVVVMRQGQAWREKHLGKNRTSDINKDTEL